MPAVINLADPPVTYTVKIVSLLVDIAIEESKTMAENGNPDARSHVANVLAAYLCAALPDSPDTLRHVIARVERG